MRTKTVDSVGDKNISILMLQTPLPVFHGHGSRRQFSAKVYLRDDLPGNHHDLDSRQGNSASQSVLKNGE